ncbi:4-(cytidine 5'-diphospho)-2-C-methyl-D-erythritol kinase [Falsochrobactrum tianjinense]|nr:4-(cytidine 5'-diphospho)-2-C-methyl-D-erythritol kinase [Falsochrobactrum sp. TDYN1]
MDADPAIDVAVHRVTRLAPAKINLALHVTGRRDDGYHLLDMLVAFADIGDHVHIEKSGADSFRISGPFSDGIPLDSGNLVLKARDILRREFGSALPAVAIHLEKNLPIASGIGGGSSDAAATLLALNDLWKLGLSFDELATLGLTLGADLPMCLHGAAFRTPLIARGIGEDIIPVDDMPALALLLVNDGTALATPDVFCALSRRDNGALPQRAFRSLESPLESLCSYLRSTRNDLLPAALTLAPHIAKKLDLLRGHQALYAQISGSGATCFGLFADIETAQRAAAAIRSDHPGWFIVPARTASSSPIPI